MSAKGINGEPLRNLSLRNEITVGGMPVDFGTLSARNAVTGADGRATFVYTAPPSPAVAVDAFTVVDIVVTPIGSDFNNSASRTAAIRLVPPGVRRAARRPRGRLHHQPMRTRSTTRP